MTSIHQNKTLFIMIHSYKGGTGKTAITVNLAKYLSVKDHKRILVIEQDIGGPNFTHIFNINPQYYWNDFFNLNKPLKDLIVSTEFFDIVCSTDSEINIPSDINHQTFFVRQLERFKYEQKWMAEKYDIVLFDTHPGYNLALINSISLADMIILVSRRDADILINTIDLYNKIYAHFKSKKTIIIENQVPEPIPDFKIESVDKHFQNLMTKWNEFLSDKRSISIPLKNEIAYPLSLNKMLSFENHLFSYIGDLVSIIKQEQTN